jgi:ferredoxin
VDCIHPNDGAGESILFIDPDECIDCGACEPECPVEAIFAEEDLPAQWSPYIEINAKYFELRDTPAAWAKYRDSKADLLTKKE